MNSRKWLKLKNNPKLFFKDAIENKKRSFKNKIKIFKPKQSHGFSKYAIVSAVYNVEKYLDDYFKSIIHQRLDFKNNIFLILVDDGSTDNSAQIIKKYQKKYPKNIVYLYKENGGQASARNLGLKYMKENNYQTPWVTFTDPDDFLDRDYFYEVDKFLKENRHEDVCMVGCNIIFYFEKNKSFRDNHPLNFKFQQDRELIINQELNNFIQLSAASCFLNLSHLKNLLFDENLKPNFEDAKFINEYLLENLNSKSAFLKKAIYFYRKREDESSTLDTSIGCDYFIITPKLGTLDLLKTKNNINIQNVCLYHLVWQIKYLVNSPEKLSFMSEIEKQEYLSLLDENFSYIDSEIILKFNAKIAWFYYKVGMLNCFKNEYPPFQITYIEDFDAKKEQILIRYFTPDDKDIESIRFDGEEYYADYEKTIKHDFLTRVFTYEKRLWIKVPSNAKNLEIFIRGQRAKITLAGKQHQSLELKHIYNKFNTLKKIKAGQDDLWILMDRDYEADDNAEHLYRYIKQNHPEQKIAFALRKESIDYKRLKAEGFNLVNFGSRKFKKLAKKSSKIISSHADEYFLRYFKDKDFVFLQHGVTKNDISKWLNSKKIDLFITSTKREFNSIANDFNPYKFSPKEVILTGFARHDTLLKNNKKDAKQILIMPTWRKNIVGTITNSTLRTLKDDFYESRYFLSYNALLQSQILKELYQKYNYTLVFNPHPNILPYIKEFNIPAYIKIAHKNESLQKLFRESDLLITDYSSVAFEMAYLEKPVLYYQFDKEEFFSNHTLQKGYFDYETDGFGPVVETEEELLKELENLLKNNCKVGEPYKSNIENTFVFKDGKCCERIYEAILELDKPYERKYTLEYVLNLANNALDKEYFKEASDRFEFVLEHLEDESFKGHSIKLNEDLIFNYLYASRMSDNSKKALEFIKDQDLENKINLSNKTKLEIIKNYISIDDIQESIQRLESFEISKEEQKEFALIKLKIYSYLGNKRLFNQTYDELHDIHNISELDLRKELFLFQNTLLRDISNQKTNRGGGYSFLTVWK